MQKTNKLKGDYRLDLNLLKHLYSIRSFSHAEEPMTNFLKEILTQKGIEFKQLKGNLYNLSIPNAPILVAHQDMVNAYPQITIKKTEPAGKSFQFPKLPWNNQIKLGEKTKAEIEKEKKEAEFIDQEKLRRNVVEQFEIKNGIIKAFNKHGTQVSLGADDKNGIFTILELIRMGHKFNFIFTTGEECGCIGIREITNNKEIIEQIESKPFAIIIDRRNGADIIGFQNEYCIGLDYHIEKFSTEIGIQYKCAQGLCSDADELSEYLECVNLSCGYYKAHSHEEYTNIGELKRAVILCARMLEDFKYESLPPERYKEKSYGYSTKDDWGWDYEDYRNAGGWESTYTEKKRTRTTGTGTVVQVNAEDVKGNVTILCPNCGNESNISDIKYSYGCCPWCQEDIIDQEGYMDEQLLINYSDYYQDNKSGYDGGVSNSQAGFY